MRLKLLLLFATVACLGVPDAIAQLTLNVSPSRVIGHPRFDPIKNVQNGPDSVNPNLVEGRELYAPVGVAVDTSASPFPIVYVADTGNNRVLAWQYKPSLGDPNSGKFPPADMVIGQKDLYSTYPQGPPANSTGLAVPTGLAVDANGNLYVVDSGNNRILKFPRPFDPTVNQNPPIVIGQPSLNSNIPNNGGVSEKSISLSGRSASLVFDANGNLYFTDAGNHRVLRYAASDLNSNINNPAATLVLGQNTFNTNAPATSNFNTDGSPVKDKLNTPVGLALDSRGNLFVSDAQSRVLVYPPNLTANGTQATRVMGLVVNSTQQTQQRDIHTVLLNPRGIFILPDNSVAVVDQLLSRIMIFAPVDSWSLESRTVPSPQANFVVGQGGDFNVDLTNVTVSAAKAVNHGGPEASASTFALPFGAVLTKSNELFVADTGNNRVLVMPLSGSTFNAGTRVLGQDQFNYNSINLIEGREFRFVQIAGNNQVTADGGMVIDWNSSPPHLYVADTYNNRILGYNDVRTVKAGVTADLVIGQPDMFHAECNYPNNDQNRPDSNTLCQPAGLVLDSSGNLWVADGGNGRVLRFPTPFAQRGFMPAADIVVGQANFTTRIISPSNMATPYGLAFDSDSRLLVSDPAYNRVLVFEAGPQGFSNNPQPTKVLGQPDRNSIGFGINLNQMKSPQHIATDTDGRLYVADSGNSRILIFQPTAQLLSGNSALDASLQTGLNNPNSVYVNPSTGEIWVADTNNRVVRRYSRFDQILLGNNTPTLNISEITPITLTQDQFGNLYVADASNRIAIHYPGLLAVNGAHFLVNNNGIPRPLAPGIIASVCPPLRDLAQACRVDDPHQWGEQTASFNDNPNPLPLPTVLADTQVMLNGSPVPLFYVSPRQINFQVPMGIQAPGTVQMDVIKVSSGRTLGSGPVQIAVSSPGLFYTQIQTQTSPPYPPSVQVFQAAALNQDGTANTPSAPAGRGTIVSLFGTGQGFLNGAPADGDVAQPGVNTPVMPRVVLGTCFLDDTACTKDPDSDVLFSGLAPGLVGVWQVNIKIPQVTSIGNVVVALVYNSLQSNDPQRLQTTIAVKQSQ